MTTFTVTFRIYTTGELRTVRVTGTNLDDAKIRARRFDSQVNYGNAELLDARPLQPLRAV